MKASENPILIAGAVSGEVADIARKLRNPVSSVIGRRKIFSGFLHNLPVQIMATGPGLLNTVQALTSVIEKKRPAMIIQTGCAGVFRQSGLEIGDIAVAEEEIDVQLGLESPGKEIPEELPFALMHRGGAKIRNRYLLNAGLSEKAGDVLRSAFRNKGIRVRNGPFVTVSTITASDERADILYRHFSPLMENMEGAAGAFLGLHYGIPCIEIRAAGNFCGKRAREQWNLELAFERCTAAVLSFLRDPVLFQFLLRKFD